MMSNDKLIAKNPTAFHNYNIENKLEAVLYFLVLKLNL